MLPFSQFPPEHARALRYVLCDIDDTLTLGGKLPAEAYAALWRLTEAGIAVIPITGRPAGWCDLIVREWPVRAVVGENGAFVFYLEEGRRRMFLHPEALPDAPARLEALRRAVLEKVPGSRVAQDQFARLYDLAIDFAEEPPDLGLEAAEEIRRICVSMGAMAKVSSIHVNTWFGGYDKLSTTRLFAENILGESDLAEKALFFGDSPNDEPMFSYFPQSCGVANVRRFAGRMKHLPAYVTASEGGPGFAEAVSQLLRLRQLC